jgi:NTE family protein
MDRPDVLVLGAGGTLGEAWMRGLLSGLASAGGPDMRECEYFVGTSAGSIVAAALAGGRRPEAGDRAAREWASRAEPEPPGRLNALAGMAARAGAAAVAPLAPVALAGAAPVGRAVRAASLAAAPRTDRTLGRLGEHIAALGTRFDGRLRIAAVDKRSGRRVMFGSPGAPRAEVAEAVLASCAVPWIFAPVRIGEREYVDGGVWSPTNLDAAPARRGTQVLCLVPTASLPAARSPAGALRAFSTTAVAAETLALRARGAKVRTIAPDPDAAAAMAPDLMNGRRAEQVLDAAFAQGRALAAP